MHISELIRMQSVGASFCFCLKNHPKHYFHTLGWRGLSRWRISPVPIALWILLSAAQKQGRPHSGTETQLLPRLLQLENKKKSKWTGFNIQERLCRFPSTPEITPHRWLSIVHRSSGVGSFAPYFLRWAAAGTKTRDGQAWTKTVWIRSRKSMTLVLQNLTQTPRKPRYQDIPPFDNLSSSVQKRIT